MKISEGLTARLDKTKLRYEELGGLLARPEVISDQNTFRAYSKEHSELEPVVECYDKYLADKRAFDECTALSEGESDPEMKELLKEELDGLRDALDRMPPRSKSRCFPATPTRTTMSSWKSARERAATRRRFSARNS